jgi:hypothetical protein
MAWMSPSSVPGVKPNPRLESSKASSTPAAAPKRSYDFFWPSAQAADWAAV